MKTNGGYAALVSGGFTAFTTAVAAHLGFDENRANTLLTENGRLTGDVARPIVGREAKVAALKEISAWLGITHDAVMAVGDGANPMRDGTPGGGSGGAIYNDGGEFTLRVCGTRIEDNHANEGGGAIFFVSNDRTGSLLKVGTVGMSRRLSRLLDHEDQHRRHDNGAKGRGDERLTQAEALVTTAFDHPVLLIRSVETVTGAT